MASLSFAAKSLGPIYSRHSGQKYQRSVVLEMFSCSSCENLKRSPTNILEMLLRDLCVTYRHYRSTFYMSSFVHSLGPNCKRYRFFVTPSLIFEISLQNCTLQISLWDSTDRSIRSHLQVFRSSKSGESLRKQSESMCGWRLQKNVTINTVILGPMLHCRWLIFLYSTASTWNNG